MKIHIKNQTGHLIQFCLGDGEYSLNPEEEVEAEVKDGDCMYIDLI